MSDGGSGRKAVEKVKSQKLKVKSITLFICTSIPNYCQCWGYSRYSGRI